MYVCTVQVRVRTINLLKEYETLYVRADLKTGKQCACESGYTESKCTSTIQYNTCTALVQYIVGVEISTVEPVEGLRLRTDLLRRGSRFDSARHLPACELWRRARARDERPPAPMRTQRRGAQRSSYNSVQYEMKTLHCSRVQYCTLQYTT